MTDPVAFVLAETRLTTPSHVPELRLHLADAAVPLWQATEAQMAARDLPPPYWAFAWPGGQAVARLLLDRPELVRGRRVVDFGAGSGIAALAAALSGACEARAIEIDRFALAAIGLNAAANGLEVMAVDDPAAMDRPVDCEVLLLGDMCYERPLAQSVVGWARAAARRGTRVLLGDPGRAYKPDDGLAEIARYDVPTSLDLEDRAMRDTVVWQLLP